MAGVLFALGLETGAGARKNGGVVRVNAVDGRTLSAYGDAVLPKRDTLGREGRGRWS